MRTIQKARRIGEWVIILQEKSDAGSWASIIARIPDVVDERISDARADIVLAALQEETTLARAGYTGPDALERALARLAHLEEVERIADQMGPKESK